MATAGPNINILLGDPRTNPRESPSYTVIGTTIPNKSKGEEERIVGFDLNTAHTISLFGGQGSGKSCNSDAIIESMLGEFPGINKLPNPFAAVYFHYSQTMEYAPEPVTMVRPNDIPAQVDDLMKRFGAKPEGLRDVLLVTPEAEVAARRLQYPDLAVEPMLVHPSELTADQWLLLLGLIGDNSYYARIMLGILRENRNSITIEAIERSIGNAPLTPDEKRMATGRLMMAKQFMTTDVNQRASRLLKPGRLVIVDIRDPFLVPEDAFTMMVVLFQVWSSVSGFKKAFKFGECHKYTHSKTPLVMAMIQAVREMRHKGIYIIFDSQDPLSVPNEIVAMSDILCLMQAPARIWYDHLAALNMTVAEAPPRALLELYPPFGLIVSRSVNANDRAVTEKPLHIRWRPRVTKHGGDTKTTVKTASHERDA